MHDADGYARELFAGGVICPKCKKDIETWVKVLGRRESGSPVLDCNRNGVCLECDVEIEAKLMKPLEA